MYLRYHLMHINNDVKDGTNRRHRLQVSVMAGDAFSMADTCAYTFVASIHKRLPWYTPPRMARWFDIIEARPGVQQGMQAFND
jgi:glutathione S-transferase